jgi:putative holliday junction resolvase
MGRVLGIDYGTRRIGVAMSDPLKITAQPYDTWRKTDEVQLVSRINGLVRAENVDLVVVGFPLTLKGTLSLRSSATERFRARLSESCPVPVVLWDERFTTVQAHRALHLMGKQPSRNRERVDVIAAALTLQSYPDGHPTSHSMDSKSD